MFEGFPYTNFHELNTDWIIKIAKDFLDQYTNIQQTITQGLEDLDTKEQQLEALLDAWYTEHSDDIAQQLADALQDLNTWYTTHQGYLDQYLQDSITAFGTAADAKAAETIASIPDDYTALSNQVDDTQDHTVSLAGEVETFLPPTVLKASNTAEPYPILMGKTQNDKMLIIRNDSASAAYFGYALLLNNTEVYGTGTAEADSTIYITPGDLEQITIPANIEADTIKIRNRNAQTPVTAFLFTPLLNNTKFLAHSLVDNVVAYPSNKIKEIFPIYSRNKCYQFTNIVDYKTKLQDLEETNITAGAYSVIVPLKGIKRISYPMTYSPSLNYGSLIFNSNDEVIWKYRDPVGPNGRINTIDVPDYAAYMLFVLNVQTAALDWNLTLYGDDLAQIRTNDKDQAVFNTVTEKMLGSVIKLYPYDNAGDSSNGGNVFPTTRTITIPASASGYNSYVGSLFRAPDYLAGKPVTAMMIINSTGYQIDTTDVFFLAPNGTSYAVDTNIVPLDASRTLAVIKAVLPASLNSYYNACFQVKKNYLHTEQASITIEDITLISSDYTDYVTDNIYGVSFLEVGTGKEYTSLRAALEKAAKSATKHNHVVVKYYGEGAVYDVMNDITAGDLTSDSTFRGLVVPAYTKLLGMGSREQNKIALTLPAGTPSDVAFRISTVNLDENGELENVWIYGSGCRYACHDDTQTRNPEWNLKTVKNCKFTSDFTNQHRAYGAGYRSGVHWRFENCLFENVLAEAQQYGNAAFSAHNNNAMEQAASITFVNCQFDGGHGVTFESLNRTTGQTYPNAKSMMAFYGCKATARTWSKAIIATLPGESTSETLEVCITGFANNFDNDNNMGVYYSGSFHPTEFRDQLTVWGMIS